MFKTFKEFILRTSAIRRLEKENTKLRNSIIRATDLVSDYRDAMKEMQSFLNIMAQREMSQNRMGVDENPFGDLFESEEEGDFDQVQMLRKKNLLN
jgi:DNA-binding ferritin-like protein (Dps family)